jgi:type II secretory pathway component HofQ
MRNQPVKQEVQIARENRKLTGPQKEYVNKLNPKHYIEKEKDKRVRKFDGPEYENAYDKLQKKNKKLIRKLRRKLEVIED